MKIEWEAMIPLVKFHDEEDGIWYVHCPVLEITGYGKNAIEADDSFKVMLEEIVQFMVINGTLDKELRRMGWKSEEGHLKPPAMEKLLGGKNQVELRRMMATRHTLDYYRMPVHG